MTCSVGGCDREAKTRGWCRMHYLRWYKTGDPTKTRPGRWDGYDRPTCSVEECAQLSHAHGYCTSHYKRWERYGDPLAGGRYLPPRTVYERFLGFVDVRDLGTCWEWTGTKISKGYGEFSVDGENVYAHRWSYEHHVGPIPEGLVIDHLCCNQGCVNPEHLEPVTNEENLRRARDILQGEGYL